jgi:hypothetical protein
MDGALRTCHDAVKYTIARSAVDADFRVEVVVYGARVHSRSAAQRRGLGKNPIYFWEPILWLCRV